MPPTINNLVISGDPGAAMTGKICQQKAIIVNSGVNTTLQGIELFGALTPYNMNLRGLRVMTYALPGVGA